MKNPHPILLICNILPETWSIVTDPLLNKLAIILISHNLWEIREGDSFSREELTKILVEILPEIGLAYYEGKLIKQSNLTKEIIKYYGH
jgi:hypothetical protein